MGGASSCGSCNLHIAGLRVCDKSYGDGESEGTSEDGAADSMQDGTRDGASKDGAADGMQDGIRDGALDLAPDKAGDKDIQFKCDDWRGVLVNMSWVSFV